LSILFKYGEDVNLVKLKFMTDFLNNNNKSICLQKVIKNEIKK